MILSLETLEFWPYFCTHSNSYFIHADPYFYKHRNSDVILPNNGILAPVLQELK